MNKNIKEKWKGSLEKLKNVNFWKDTELPSNKFTAIASFSEIINNKIVDRGKCLNIDSNNTIASKICCNSITNMITRFTQSRLIYLIILFNILGVFCILYIMFGYKYISISLVGTFFWILIPVILFLDSNISILHRIWMKTFRPWIHIYSSLLETIAFCDLCNWDYRTIVIFPAMLFNQIIIINSDAVFFKLPYKNIPLVQIFLSIFWKFIIIYCLRFNYFKNIFPRNIIELATSNSNITNSTQSDEKIFYLNNASLFFTKSMSLFLILCGQAYFKIKHKSKLFFLHTNYTIKKNKEWNMMNRNQRIHRKNTINKQVSEFKNKLSKFSSKQEIIL